jgi:hypothetical protein
MTDPRVTETSTLLEQLSRACRFDDLADWLPKIDPHPTYLYVSLFIVFDLAVVNTYTHVTGGTHAVLRNPFYVALSVGILLAVVGVKYMHEGHTDAITVLTERKICDANRVDDYAVSVRTKLLFYAVGLLGFFTYQVFVIGVPTILQNQGFSGIAFTLLIVPGCYLPVAIDFVGEYVTLHILIPQWLGQQETGLFFFDPQNMGGFQPLGELLKNSYYLYTAGLLLYLVFFYGAFIFPIQGDIANPPGAFEAALFTALWLLGLATISYSMYKIHQIMKSERKDRLRDIESEIREIIDNPHDISNAEITDQDRLDALEYRLGQIRATSEYPTTFTMWTQIGISVLLPQLLQLMVQSTV